MRDIESIVDEGRLAAVSELLDVELEFDEELELLRRNPKFKTALKAVRKIAQRLLLTQRAKNLRARISDSTY